jgi:hypothetical protein
MTLSVQRPHLKTPAQIHSYLISYYPNEQVLAELDRFTGESIDALTECAVQKALTIAKAERHHSIRILITATRAIILGQHN